MHWPTSPHLQAHLRALLKAFVLSMLVAYVAPAFAVDFGDYGPIRAGFNKFMAKIGVITTAALEAPDYAGGVQMMYLAFGTVLAVWTIGKSVLAGFRLIAVVELVMLLGMTQALMNSYNALTSAIWSMGIGLGSAIQLATLGTSDLFFGPAFISQLISNMSMPDLSWDAPVKIVYAVLASLLLGVVSLVLGALSFIVTTWGVWGYALAKIIGFLFLPFLLFERLTFLFDGWLRFFLGFIVYVLIARVNMVLVVLSMAMYLGFPFPPSIAGMPTIVIPEISQLVELMGLFVFFGVGIVALWSTGKFASAVLAGAGGGGMGMAIHGAAMSVAKIAMRV